MKTTKINNKEYQIPSEWIDLTIGQCLDIVTIGNRDYDMAIEQAYDSLEALGVSSDDLNNSTIEEIATARNIIFDFIFKPVESFLTKQKIEQEKNTINNSINLLGQEFSIIDIKKMKKVDIINLKNKSKLLLDYPMNKLSVQYLFNVCELLIPEASLDHLRNIPFIKASFMNMYYETEIKPIFNPIKKD